MRLPRRIETGLLNLAIVVAVMTTVPGWTIGQTADDAPVSRSTWSNPEPVAHPRPSNETGDHGAAGSRPSLFASRPANRETGGDSVYSTAVETILGDQPRPLIPPTTGHRDPWLDSSRFGDSWLSTSDIWQTCTHPGFCPAGREFVCNARSDYRNWLSCGLLAEFGLGLGVAAAFANTSVDEDFRQWAIREDLLEPLPGHAWYREFGNGTYVAPTMVALICSSRLYQKCSPHHAPCAHTIDRWSSRSMRSLLVGAPILLATQWVTGASRPDEASSGSRWVPFNDTNGASGHTFVGAVPFLVAAQMAKRPVVKVAFIAGSGLTGWGRICDDGHYLSQVLLGWTIAHVSVRASQFTETGRQPYRLRPLRIGNAQGIGIEFRR